MRKPQYTTDRAYRIVSLPNGEWQLQKHNQTEGTKTNDPWEKRSHSLSLSEAQVLIRQHQPPKQKVA